jgi:polyisoprenoid-binding protein YceI
MKHLLILVTAIALTTTINAQKLYSTKSGKISFESKAPLEDIEAKNSEVESKLLASNGQIVFNLLIKGFQFENQLMEDHFNENYLESSKYPKADFKGFITNIKDINFAKDGTYPAKAKGKLTIHGVTRDVSSDGTITVKNGKVRANSKFDIKLKDYNIGGSMIGKKIAEAIVIKVDSQYE